MDYINKGGVLNILESFEMHLIQNGNYSKTLQHNPGQPSLQMEAGMQREHSSLILKGMFLEAQAHVQGTLPRRQNLRMP